MKKVGLFFVLFFISHFALSQEVGINELEKQAKNWKVENILAQAAQFYNQSDYRIAYNCLKESSNYTLEGKNLAQYSQLMGHFYYFGLGKVKKDYQKALEYYMVAANMDCPVSACNIGLMYDNGQGVAVNKLEAVKWYEKAANLDYPRAIYNLALMYAHGEGVEVNTHEAIRLYEKAAAKNHTNSMNNLGYIYYNGTATVSKNYELAEYWWRKAAELGNRMAKDNLRLLPTNLRNTTKQNNQKTTDAINDLGQALYNLGQALGGGNSQSQTTTQYEYNSTNTNNYSSGSTSKSSDSKRCDECLGNGKCSGSGSSSKYHCHGSGKCYACNGKSRNGVGMHQTAGHYGDCYVCNNSGKCKYCNGTGKCTKCKGSGKI